MIENNILIKDLIYQYYNINEGIDFSDLDDSSDDDDNIANIALNSDVYRDQVKKVLKYTLGDYENDNVDFKIINITNKYGMNMFIIDIFKTVDSYRSEITLSMLDCIRSKDKNLHVFPVIINNAKCLHIKNAYIDLGIYVNKCETFALKTIERTDNIPDFRNIIVNECNTFAVGTTYLSDPYPNKSNRIELNKNAFPNIKCKRLYLNHIVTPSLLLSDISSNLLNHTEQIVLCNSPINSLEGCPQSLKSLKIYHMDNLPSLNGIANKIGELELHNIAKLTNLDGLQNSTIDTFVLSKCKNMISLKGIGKVIHDFTCAQCPQLSDKEFLPYINNINGDIICPTEEKLSRDALNLIDKRNKKFNNIEMSLPNYYATMQQIISAYKNKEADIEWNDNMDSNTDLDMPQCPMITVELENGGYAYYQLSGTIDVYTEEYVPATYWQPEEGGDCELSLKTEEYRLYYNTGLRYSDDIVLDDADDIPNNINAEEINKEIGKINKALYNEIEKSFDDPYGNYSHLVE